MKRPRQSLRQVFAVPMTLAVLSLVGLIAALTGDGQRDVLSWIALGVPVLAVVWAMKFRRS
ncbi:MULTISPECIES: hypothetical protein [unclassified Novosphingobium]|uniref:hypothetical protein n=1 Tax=unclassified Novosphingobium TaxID=2644732 RepID=UPI0013573486|nr:MULTISPECIES: hypothetical protein [unclassified Novosphingobium]